TQAIPGCNRDVSTDGDAYDHSLTITSATATNGTVVIVGATNLLFTPAPDFNGTATITYTISDGNGGNASATVTVTVTPVNDAPRTEKRRVGKGREPRGQRDRT